MFGWIAYARRPLKKIELQSAITFASGNPDEEDVVPGYVLGLCSQLVEERHDSTLVLIHGSVKECNFSTQTDVESRVNRCLDTSNLPSLYSSFQSRTLFWNTQRPRSPVFSLPRCASGLLTWTQKLNSDWCCVDYTLSSCTRKNTG